MPMTKAQIEQALELFERYVEAHEALAEAAVILTTPTVVSGEVSPPSVPAAAVSEDEASTTGDTEPSSSDPFSLGDSEPTPAADDAPSPDEAGDWLDTGEAETELDITDAKAVEEFKATLGNLLREYGAAVGPETVLDLIEEVAETRKFSEVPNDKLAQLHDSVYDAMNENG